MYAERSIEDNDLTLGQRHPGAAPNAVRHTGDFFWHLVMNLKYGLGSLQFLKAGGVDEINWREHRARKD